MAQAPAPDALARARTAYNAGKFEDAIAAATDAMKIAASSNAAAVVLGRAHLQRFSAMRIESELEDARRALRQVVADKLSPRDYVEYLVGLGQSLYLDPCDGCPMAAAEVFDRALARAETSADRELVFEWWAASLDRQAQSQENDRALIYRRILDAATKELDRNDRSASASYWLVAAARGISDPERAWGAAIAGWARSRSMGERADGLRADLDRFVTQVLLPERARQMSGDADAKPALAMLVAQWEEVKRKYS